MAVDKLLAYILLFVGLMDVVVIPRILVAVWKKRGEIRPEHGKIVRILRTGGGILILLGALIHFKIISV